MKKAYLLLFIHSVLFGVVYAQVIPKGMQYQAVARKQNGEIIPNENIALRITLFSKKQEVRKNHYSELHNPNTNDIGLFSLVLGEGKTENGEYNTIPWNTENIWIEVAIKDPLSSGFITFSQSKLMAVPYAIHSISANKLIQYPISSFTPPEPGVISTFWSVLGNAKTDASGNIFRINSLGTTDFVDLIMITNNEERLRILPGGDIVSKFNFEIGKNLNVGQKLFVLQNAVFDDSLLAKKEVILNTISGQTINYGPFTVADYMPSLFTGKLTVDGKSFFNTRLNVDGTTNLNSRLNVNNMSPVKLTGTLRVDSTTTLNSALNVLNISPTILSGTLTVDSMATFNDRVKIRGLHQTDTTTGSSPSGAIQVGGGAYVKENFYIGGLAKFEGPAVFGGAVGMSDLTQSTDSSTGALKVKGGVGIGLNVNVGGMAMFTGMTTIKDTTHSFNPSTGALKVYGGVGIRKKLQVNGYSEFSNKFRINGLSTLQGYLSVTNGHSYIAQFVNTSNQNGISIQIDNSTPGIANNLIEFANSQGNVVGRIEGETSAQLLQNPKYLNDLIFYDARITRAQYNVAVTAIDLAAAIAGVAASAGSGTACIGFGGCYAAPVVSLITTASLKATILAGAVVAVSLALDMAHDEKQAYIDYRAARAGVTYESGAGDYAEWLPKLNLGEALAEGYIVGLHNGKVSKNTTGATKVLVISSKPAVLGNMPSDAERSNYSRIAFMGQVPVWVRGIVNAGDYILPSGENNGFGKAISPEHMTPSDYTKIVGIAWSSSANDALNRINVAIGLHGSDISKAMASQEAMYSKLKSDFQESNVLLSKSVKGFKKAANQAGLFDDAPDHRIESPALIKSNEINSESIQTSNTVFKNQLEEALSFAQKTFVMNGGDIKKHPFWQQMNTDPEYKKQVFNNINDYYLQEIQKKWDAIRQTKKK